MDFKTGAWDYPSSVIGLATRREVRGYANANLPLQLTGIQINDAATPTPTKFLDLTYSYPASPNNDGRITSEAESVTNITTSYQYDKLARLSSASSTNWGLAFGYDEYGNRTGQSVTAGAALAFTATYNANNQMSGTDACSNLYSYDANGNQLRLPDCSLLAYDADNRMSKWSRSGSNTEYYQYHPGGARVWKYTAGAPPSSTFYLYGPSGQMLADTSGNEYVYFAGRQMYAMNAWKGTVQYFDRLGTKRKWEGWGQSAGSISYYPFGDRTGAGTNSTEFASTYRDASSGLDYAINRYYSSSMGRFLSADPYMASGGPSDPQSWNRYGYGANDPVNRYDPTGLMADANPGDTTGDCIAVYVNGISWGCLGGTGTGTIGGGGGGICQVGFVGDPLVPMPTCGAPPPLPEMEPDPAKEPR